MKKLIILPIIIFCFLFSYQSVSAIECCDNNNSNNCRTYFSTQCPPNTFENTGGTYPGISPAGITNPVQQQPKTGFTLPNYLGVTDPNVFIGRVIKIVTGLLGTAALLMFIYGGFIWLTSGGNDTKVNKGRDTLIYAAIGLLIVFSAYIIVNYVIDKLIGI